MIAVAILGAAHPHVSYGLDEVARSPDLELVATAEPDPSLRARYLPDLDVPNYQDSAQLLARHEVDVAVVAGRYADRAYAVLAALSAGAHVLADKPLCTSIEQLDAIEAAIPTGCHVSIVFEKRGYPATVSALELLAAGTLGDLALIASTGPHKLNLPTRPPWFLRRTDYGSIAADLPVHDIDLVLRLSGARSGTISAVSGNVRQREHPEFDDYVAVLLRAGPVVATIEANWLSPQAAPEHGHYRMRITGSEGTAELDWTRDQLLVATHDRPPWQPALPAAMPPAANFFNAVRTGATPAVTTAESLLATRVALLAACSTASGGEVLAWEAADSDTMARPTDATSASGA